MFHMFMRIMEGNGNEILQETKKNVFFFFFFLKSSEKESKLEDIIVRVTTWTLFHIFAIAKMFHMFIRIMEWK